MNSLIVCFYCDDSINHKIRVCKVAVPTFCNHVDPKGSIMTLMTHTLTQLQYDDTLIMIGIRLLKEVAAVPNSNNLS